MPTFDFRESARCCYETLALVVPDVQLKGLFTDGTQYFFVCAGATTRLVDGQPLGTWFYGRHVPICSPFVVCEAAPVGGTEVPARTAEEIALAKGHASTIRQIWSQLSLALPHDFPLVDIRDGEGFVRVVVADKLADDEADLLAQAVREIGLVPPYEVEVDAGPAAVAPADGFMLTPARALAPSLTSALAVLVEEDEEHWRASRIGLLTAVGAEPVQRGPWNDLQGSACLVSTTFKPDNIRRYFSFYSQVVLVAPLASRLEDTLKCLSVTRHELTSLVASGHVRVLFPQSLDRYDQKWVEELAEAGADGLLFSRRLTSVALQDMRRRLPVLFTPAPVLNDRTFLRSLSMAIDAAPAHARPFFSAMLTTLPECWDKLESALNLCGAMAALDGPLVRFAAKLLHDLTGRNLWLELGSASAPLEWAGALGADYCPAEHEEYSEAGAAALLSALHTGFGGAGAPSVISQELVLADNLLGVDNDADIASFVRDLGASDRDRLRALVRDLSKANPSEDEVRDAIDKWNSFVRKYELKPDRVRAFGLAGIVLAGAKALSGGPSALATVTPWLAALMPYVMTHLSEDLVRENALLGRFLDRVNGALAGAPPNAVLLSRMRKRVSAMKNRPFHS